MGVYIGPIWLLVNSGMHRGLRLGTKFVIAFGPRRCYQPYPHSQLQEGTYEINDSDKDEDHGDLRFYLKIHQTFGREGILRVSEDDP